MYITTFYSYKGGVGRTLALVNVACDLAQRGRRVLIVDFDLEAPGLPSYELFAPAIGKKGLVDYVTKYLETNEAPNVKDYISISSNPNIFIMPAGSGDGDYTTRLASINWQELYQNRSGYLMLEDMKSQWEEAIQPDYVLIDSRTGHNDIGGICTRHLPNAVVAVFFPNRQNMDGMAHVTQTIRNEVTRAQNPIKIQFVPSRVPSLDDEEEILSCAIKYSEQKLGYERPAAVIHQYDSMSLLNDSIFINTHPKSRLAKEYGRLTTAIISENFEDAEGAISYLKSLRRKMSFDGEALDLNSDLILAKIGSLHERNGKILEELGNIQSARNEYEAAYTLFSAAVDVGNKAAGVFRKKAQTMRMLNKQKEPEFMQTVEAIFSAENPQLNDIAYAIRTFKNGIPENLRGGLTGVISKFNISEQTQAAYWLTNSYDNLDLAEAILRSVINEQLTASQRDDAESNLVLVLIGLKKYADAIALSESTASERAIARQFNKAMGLWGLNGTPNINEFQNVVALENAKMRDPNYLLCLAISYGVIGNKEEAKKRLNKAILEIHKNPVPTFSPWQYLIVSLTDFLSDANYVSNFIESGPTSENKPSFMTSERQPSLLH